MGVCLVLAKARRGSDSLRLELWIAVSHPVYTGNWIPWVLWKSSQVLLLAELSPAPLKVLLSNLHAGACMRTCLSIWRLLEVIGHSAVFSIHYGRSKDYMHVSRHIHWGVLAALVLSLFLETGSYVIVPLALNLWSHHLKIAIINDLSYMSYS